MSTPEERILGSVSLSPEAFDESTMGKFSEALDRAKLGMDLLEARDDAQSPDARHKDLVKIEKGARALLKAIKSANDHLVLDLNYEVERLINDVHHLPSNFPDVLEAYLQAVTSERQHCDPDHATEVDGLPESPAMQYVITNRLPKIYGDFIEPILDEPFSVSIYKKVKGDGSVVQSVSYGIKFIQACLFEFGREKKAETIKRRFFSRSD